MLTILCYSASRHYQRVVRTGKYFANYFIMGGERFETNQQDVYLFGENDDLNFLGNKPIPVSVMLHVIN